MSRRKRDPAQPLIGVAAPDPHWPDLLDGLGERVAPAQADILFWTPESAQSAPMPVGPVLNVLDLRFHRPRREWVHPSAGLLLAETAAAAGAWSALAPGIDVAVGTRALIPAGAPSGDLRGLHILLGADPGPDRIRLAEDTAAWARSNMIPCGIAAPSGSRGLALAARIGPAPALAPGIVMLDLGDGHADPVLDALATGAPVLFCTETPLRAALERAGAARRIEDMALDGLTAAQRREMSAAALAYVREHHDPALVAAALRRSLSGALANHRRLVAHWSERGPGCHVLVISDEALNLVDIRVHLPFAALARRGAISGYSLLHHGDFVFSTVPITSDLRFGVIWVQRSTDPLVQLLLRSLGKPFIYDLDDLLLVSPCYRPPFPAESIAVARALVQDAAALSCATPRLARSLEIPGAIGKTVVTPNLADGAPQHASGRARTVVWASSDQPALAGSRAEVERAVRDFCLAHRLKLLCIGAEPPAIFAGAELDIEHVGLLSYDAYLARLQDAAPGILVGPLDTASDPETQAFIDAKSDIKLIEAGRAGLVGVFSRAAPYAESDLPPPILCDNGYRAWLDGLEQARQACERPGKRAAWPDRRAVDALGLLPWAEALRRAPTDLGAAEIADALRFIRAQGETLLTEPDRFDEADYLRRHDDVRAAVENGTIRSGYRHYVQSGYREGRAAQRLELPGDAGEFWWGRLLRTVSRVEQTVAARDAEIESLRDRVALRRALPRPAAPTPEPAASDALPWHPAGSIAGACPVCDAPGPHRALLEILGQSLGRCRKCGSCFYAERTPYRYENEAEAAILLQLYLEQNAGIHQQTGLLFALDFVDSVLDVGCGFGFTVDLATSVLGWRAVGLDPSAMGEAGAATLGADIRPSYLAPETDLGAAFGLVIASEVIEHVPDPYPFLALLRYALAPGGTLVLTTPDAGALEPGIGAARALCITAPRVHLVLFTRESLTLALQRAGFRHVQVTARGDSLLALASDRELRLRADAGQAHLAAYRTYLEGLLDRAAPGTPLWNGAAGRLLALLAPSAELSLLHDLFARIAAAWRERFGIDLARLRLPTLLTEVGRRAETAAGLCARQPLNLAGVLLNRALMESRTPGRTPEQVLAFARPAYLHALQTGRVLQAANMIDHDLRQSAIRARMLIVDALAELAPEVEVELLRGLAEPSPGALAEWLDPAPEALAARLAPAFTAAVAADRFDDAARLEPWMRDLCLLSRALAAQPEILLRALFTIGVHRLVAANDPAAALEAFTQMADEARRRIDAIGHHDFLRIAREHMHMVEDRIREQTGPG